MKLHIRWNATRDGESLPAWGRGLKRECSDSCRCDRIVAPRVGAWIETAPVTRGVIDTNVAPRVGAWIETSCPCTYGAYVTRRSPRGGVD